LSAVDFDAAALRCQSSRVRFGSISGQCDKSPRCPLWTAQYAASLFTNPRVRSQLRPESWVSVREKGRATANLGRSRPWVVSSCAITRRTCPRDCGGTRDSVSANCLSKDVRSCPKADKRTDVWLSPLWIESRYSIHAMAMSALPPRATCAVRLEMSALGQKQTYALQSFMSALPPIATAKADFRRAMSALPPKADMRGATRDVRFGPIADSCTAAKCPVIRPPRRRARSACLER